ncbi:MAG: hypothetical protein K1X74_16020 [Pirellulales bacterium]|nr:hypothetical protein [Pirellulales bacterium]
MKTERRPKNELADALMRTAEGVKPYSTYIFGGVLALIVVGGIYVYLSNTSEAQKRAAWDSFNDATNDNKLEQLDDLARDFPDAPAGLWAQLVAANKRLEAGGELLFSNRTAARDELRKAVEGFDAVRETAQIPLLREQAIWGAARAYESLGYESRADMETALKLYEQLAEIKDSPFASIARLRADDLKREGTKQFYDWFATQQLEGTAPAGGQTGLDDLNTLGEGPDIVPSQGTPPVDTPPPTTETSPTETPATETPAGEAPPTDNAPADTAPATP